MFETLTDKLEAVFKKLRGQGRLTERDVDAALKEVRLALLEADVNLKVVGDFINRVRQRAVGADVLGSLTPGQQVIKVVHEELVRLLGEPSKLQTSPQAPTVVMLVGLQGSGKTTAAAKLGLLLKKNGARPLLVAADLRRPAAVEQLATLAQQTDLPVYREAFALSAPVVCANSLKRARELGSTHLILDTGGRLHIDDQLMAELREIKRLVPPTETLLVVDAMTGQDAVRAAGDFHQKVGLTGLVLSKLDGDARGGAALSVRHVTGVPIKYIGVGERVDALEPFYPDRLASRILGMGDVLSLIERAQQTVDEEQTKKLEKKLRQAKFDLDDFLGQMQQVRKMGGIAAMLEMLPGFSRVSRQLPAGALDEGAFKKVEAIIYSMTPQERHSPEVIDGSRRRRIAKGSGAQVADVNQLLNQFRQAQQLMRQLSKRGGKGMGGMLGR
ncbi:MAG: signal recognition particle protein [Chloroflexi bacterium]|nr:signal recognition particle protein [Chloroflexota bacterium]